METIPERQLFIDGQWVRPMRGDRLDVICPSTELRIGSIPAANEEDIHRAVQAASAAMSRPTWGRKTTGTHRATLLRQLAAAVREHKPHLARLETLDCGKPIAEAEWDMDDVAGCLDYYASLAEQLDARQGTAIQVPMTEFTCHMRYDPLGVVGAITPWNYPLLMAMWKVAPALAAGCAIVLKPSEHASLTCLEFAHLAQSILPPGVLNVVTGLGQTAGAALAAHPLVARVAFTGSVPTGRAVAMAGAQHVKPVGLELGGKSALLVFDDADVNKAVEWCMFGVFWTNGQICSSTSRLLLHEKIAPAFYAQLKKRAKEIKLCDPLVTDCRMGPVINKAQHSRILDFIAAAQKEGATILVGGQRPRSMDRGYYIEPTVFVNVKRGMKLWREEVFGPVLACMTFQTEEEAISLANDSDFGLAAAVISACQDRCNRVAAALECGIVWVNCSQPAFCQAPWGGVKQSGYGRDLGTYGLDNFLSPKQVTTYVSNEVWSWYPPADTTAPQAKM